MLIIVCKANVLAVVRSLPSQIGEIRRSECHVLLFADNDVTTVDIAPNPCDHL